MIKRFAAVLASLLLVPLFPLGAASIASAVEPTYVAVIDAGSSGSRIGLFSFAGGHNPVTSLFSAKPEVPALSDFESRPSDAGRDGIAPLLALLDADLATRGIARSKVPVALLATAGMRRVEIRDPQVAQQIMASGRAAIVAARHPVRAAEVMSGDLEAGYAWIDSNAETMSKNAATHGILEVGGASAQVSFQTSAATVPDAITFRLDGRLLHVVSMSWLGLGVNDVRAAMKRGTGGGASCYPNNAVSKKPKWYEAQSTLPVRSATSHYFLARCDANYQRQISRIGRSPINKSENAGVLPDTVRSLPSFATTTFQVAGVVPFMFSDFGIARNGNESRRLGRALDTTCSGADSWPKVAALYTADSVDRAEVACANATYVRSYIFSAAGLGIAPKNLNTDVQGDVKWARGFAWFELHGGKRVAG